MTDKQHPDELRPRHAKHVTRRLKDHECKRPSVTPPGSPEQPQTAAGQALADECIETDWPRDAKGYGLKYIAPNNWRSNRWAWTQANGPIPSGLFVCHACDNPPCINAAHLFLGTPADNMRDRDAKGRAASGDRNGSRLHPERRPRGPAMRHPMPGEANGRAKLTEADVAEIRKRHGDGKTSTAIALDYGLHPATVRKIVNGSRWSHV